MRDPDKGDDDDISFSRERGRGSREDTRERGSSGTRGYIRPCATVHLLPPPLCVARPDFRPIPRRGDSKRKRVRPSICAIRTESWEKSARLSIER